MSDDPVLLSRVQIRGARALLDWSMFDLAKAAELSISTIKRAEESGIALVSPMALLSIRGAFEARGISFLPDDGKGFGLRLRRPQAT